MRHLSTSTLAVVALLCVAVPSARAQHSTDYENVNASAAGTKLTGQDGYYIPAGTNSVDFKAYTYAGNALTLPANPKGGKQFAGGTGPGGGKFARAQRDTCYLGDKWTAGFDIAAVHTGKLPTNQNLGSFSIQKFPAERSFIALARWTDVTKAAKWQVWVVARRANGTTRVFKRVPNVPDLAAKKWYRWETDFDLKTNRITEMRVMEIGGAGSWNYKPSGNDTWYLEGGSTGGGKSAPTGFRLFAGGSAATAEGNALGFDNVALALREPGTKGVATNYGSGAGRLNPAGSLKAMGLPVIDTTMKLVIDNPLGKHAKNALSALFLSAKKTDPGLKVAGFGMGGPGVAGEILIDLTAFAVINGPAPPTLPASISLAIPPDCTLVKQSVFAQGVVAGSGAMGASPHIGVTEGIELKIGNSN